METQVLSDEDVQCTTNHLTSFAVLVDHKGLIETTVCEINIYKLLSYDIHRVFQVLKDRHSQLLDTSVQVFL